MITFEFYDGMRGSVHDGEWNIAHAARLRMAKSITTEEDRIVQYLPDRDLHLATLLLATVPGKLLANDREDEELEKGMIY